MRVQWGGPYGKDSYLIDVMNVVRDEMYRLFRSEFACSHARVAIPSKSLSRIQSLFVRSRLQWRDPSTILLSVAQGVIVLTFEDYGITWDESARNPYGLETRR